MDIKKLEGNTYFLTYSKTFEGKTNAHSLRHAAGGDLGYRLPEHVIKKLTGITGGLIDHYTREDMKTLNQAVEFIGIDFKDET